jgi:broad specificity phosphatase PhoE
MHVLYDDMPCMLWLQGVCDGMTYPEIAQKFPEDYEARKKDKLRYRCAGSVCFMLLYMLVCCRALALTVGESGSQVHCSHWLAEDGALEKEAAL